MAPGVPFALLGAVQLLLVAAWCALGGTAIALRRSRVAALLVLLGALLLAAVEVRTALLFGRSADDSLALARAAGALLLAAGLYSGAFARRAAPPAVALPAEVAAGVTVPLAAAPGPALLAGVCLLAAALAAARVRRDGAGLLLAAGLAVAALATAAAPLADDTSRNALAVTVLRGLAALSVLAALVLLARTSLLGKVVAAILGGVLAMAVAAVGVVGTNVVSSYQKQADALVSEGTQQRLAALNRVGEQAQIVAPIVARSCVTPAICNATLSKLVSGSTTDDFVVRITRDGRVQPLGGRNKALSPSEQVGLARDPAIRALFAKGARFNVVPIAKLRLLGSPPMLAVVAAAPDRPASPSSVVVYGVRVDDAYASNDVDVIGTYGLSFLVDGHVIASNLAQRERQDVAAIAASAGVAQGLVEDGLTVPAEGSRPTVHFQTVLGSGDTALGVIAVSREASASLAAQRSALTSLIVTSLLATALVGGLALLLGRRTVDPVRRLTAAAARVSAGDLAASAHVRSADEVGTLSRTFDAMTTSLLGLTGDLRASAARLQTVLSSMSDGLIATDADGRVTSINPAALTMAGLPDEAAALGRPIGDVIDVRDASGASLAVPSLRLVDAAGEVHCRGVDDTVPVRVSLGPLESADGVVLVLRDTTREREVERMKTEFLSNVSHELRTPLTPIRGYAEILLARPDVDPAKVASFATTIRDESLRMGRVVDLLVDVAAIEAGRVSVDPRPVSVHELVDKRLETWKEKQPERAADFRRKLAAGLPAVLVDPIWVGKALDELIDNAVKYTPAGTAITLTAIAHDHSVRVAVRDAGPGIAEADQKTLFTSFEQVDGSATRRVGGLGLGLSFVRRLAEDAGFPLTFSSTVGKGSEFGLELPISETPVPRVSRVSRTARRPVPARDRAR